MACNNLRASTRAMESGKGYTTAQKRQKNDSSNYRPISNLCSVTKNFEKLLLERIKEIERLEGVDLTGTFQHGFKTNKSTETACLEIQSRIAENCDENKYVAVATLDLTAAFDVVNIDLLLRRLVMMGLPNQITKIIRSWLCGRTFFCSVNGKSSCFKEIISGTVQGSILGPVLYALFVSPLGDIIENLVAFADDSYNAASGNSHSEAIEDCITDTEKIITFLRGSGMKINTEKTMICVFHKGDVRQRSVQIDGLVVNTVSNLKILGVVFDSKLKWYEQVSHVIGNANKAKQALRLIAKYFSKEELLILSTAYFYSKLYYCAAVWLHGGLNTILKRNLWQASSLMQRIVDVTGENQRVSINYINNTTEHHLRCGAIIV